MLARLCELRNPALGVAFGLFETRTSTRTQCAVVAIVRRNTNALVA